MSWHAIPYGAASGSCSRPVTRITAGTTDRFVEDFVYLEATAAQYLAERKVRLVGVDYLSVGGFRADEVETHQALLKAGIWIIEGLNLKPVQPGRVQLVCLPLKIAGRRRRARPGARASCAPFGQREAVKNGERLPSQRKHGVTR